MRGLTRIMIESGEVIGYQDDIIRRYDVYLRSRDNRSAAELWEGK